MLICVMVMSFGHFHQISQIGIVIPQGKVHILRRNCPRSNPDIIHMGHYFGPNMYSYSYTLGHSCYALYHQQYMEYCGCGGRVVKASASQLGGRMFESRRVRTDMAGWLATSYLKNGTDCLTAGRLALGTGIRGNDLCK